LITSKTWIYKEKREFYYKRDRALMSLLFLTAGRISEVLSLTKEQFDFQADRNFIVIRNMILVKRLKTRKANRLIIGMLLFVTKFLFHLKAHYPSLPSLSKVI